MRFDYDGEVRGECERHRQGSRLWHLHEKRPAVGRQGPEAIGVEIANAGDPVGIAYVRRGRISRCQFKNFPVSVHISWKNELTQLTPIYALEK
jgi:hypothetical protein